MIHNESTIIFNNTNSGAFGLFLLEKFEIKSAEFETTDIEIPGRNGSVVIGKNRYKNISFPMNMYMERLFNSKIERQISLAKEWLGKAKGGYRILENNLYLDYVFKAKLTSATFSRESFQRADCTLSFDLFPFKYLKDTYSKARTLKSGETFQSKGTQIAYPIITLTGTGNVILTVNGKPFILKNVTGGVVIDCENQVVTDLAKKNSQMDKVYSYPFPTLKIGSNTISWDNTAFTGTIIERWCELA
ncbi:MAG: phage tail protein [Lactococcus cremoris]